MTCSVINCNGFADNFAIGTDDGWDVDRNGFPDKFAIGTDDGWEVDCNGFADKFAIGTDDGWEVVMALPRDPRMADGFGMERKKDLPFMVAFW